MTMVMVQVRMMVPVARRLERISDQIMTTGEAILQRLQCGPRSLSNGDIPGEVAAAVMVHALSELTNLLYLLALVILTLFSLVDKITEGS